MTRSVLLKLLSNQAPSASSQLVRLDGHAMATISPHGALGTMPAALQRFARQLYAAGWRLSEHDGLTIAGYMAFAAFTSLFPFLIFLAALASVLGTRETADETVEGLFLFLPGDVASTLAPAVHEVMAGNHGGLLTFGVLATLWTASSGVEALRMPWTGPTRLRICSRSGVGACRAW